ncbi:hypothetical protein WN943_009546 [Citrus x changshan-huyou]
MKGGFDERLEYDRHVQRDSYHLLTSWKPADKARGQGSPCCLRPPLCKDSGKALALEHPKKAQEKDELVMRKGLMITHEKVTHSVKTRAPQRRLLLASKLPQLSVVNTTTWAAT